MNLPKQIRKNGFYCNYCKISASYHVTVDYINPEVVEYSLKPKHKNQEKMLLPLYREVDLLSFKLDEAGGLQSISMGDWNKVSLDAIDLCYANHQIWGYYAKLASILGYSFYELMQLD